MRRAARFWLPLLALVLAAGGCAFRKHDDGKSLKPSDFMGPPPAASVPATAPTSEGTPPPSGADAGNAESVGLTSDPGPAADVRASPGGTPAVVVPATLPADRAYTVGAMIGQVNRTPIYADTVFEGLTPALEQNGRSMPRFAFRQGVRPMLRGRLEDLIADNLLLAEAERDLTADEQKRVKQIMEEDRAELVRRWGQGSEFVAEARLKEKTGKGLVATLDDRRRRLVIRRYMSQKFFPKLTATRKDVERYYAEHAREFNPPPRRTLRVIHAANAETAGRLEARLAAGEPFAEVAADPANTFRPDRGGLWGQTEGDAVFNVPGLNAAMASLAEGEHSRVAAGAEAWWVYVESLRREGVRTLPEAQRDIEETLRRQRLEAMTVEYRQKLLAQVSAKPIEQMTDALVEVATSRYALPE